MSTNRMWLAKEAEACAEPAIWRKSHTLSHKLSKTAVLLSMHRLLFKMCLCISQRAVYTSQSIGPPHSLAPKKACGRAYSFVCRADQHKDGSESTNSSQLKSEGKAQERPSRPQQADHMKVQHMSCYSYYASLWSMVFAMHTCT